MSPPRPKILIVDDRPANLVVMRKVLAKIKIESDILEALNGNDALALCLDHEFAVILLDVDMPGMDGYELAEFLRSEPRTAQVPLIFVTASYGDELHRNRGYDVGAVEYIQKPLDDFVLRSKVNVFLDLYVSRKSLELELAHSKAISDTLRESEARLRHAVAEAPIPIMIHAEDGSVILLNRVWTQLTGYGVDDIPSVARWAARAFGARADDILAELRALYRNPASHSESEVAVTAADGRILVWDMRSAPIERLPDGRALVISMAVDVTEHRHAEAQLARKTADLERSNADLEQFAYVASHDLREPLRMVNSFLALLEKRSSAKLDDDDREYIAFAKDGAVRMDRLILDLLEYSRIGRNALPTEAISLSLPLESAQANLQVAIQESGAVVTVPECMPSLCIDMLEMVRLFQNLIGNAIKYRHPDRAPRIAVTVESLPGEWRFCVADNGEGIDPQYFARVFQIFQRLHGRTEIAGTGIGLAVCKKVVGRYGGRIWVESTPGKGSRFLFTIPTAKGGE